MNNALLERPPYKAVGYQMIRNIKISNFRGIQEVEISNAARLNVLVGPNGTGKTAFLESIFLGGGSSPELILRLRQWRGRESQFSGSPEQIQEAFWSDTFRDPHAGSARIVLSGDDPKPRTFEIVRVGATKVISPTGEESLANVGMQFKYDGPEGPHELTPKFADGNWVLGIADRGLRPHFIPARVNVSEMETAQAFSRLKLEGRTNLFEDAFIKEFPMISDLGVEAPFGPPALYANLPSGRRLPLTMISGGINHLAGILLRIAANPKCLLLIDEIENGFYHDRYESIWRTLFDLAERSDAQIFTTTHSLECLNALRTALPDKEKSIRFIRTRMKNHEVDMEQLSGETLFRALEIGEVR